MSSVKGELLVPQAAVHATSGAGDKGDAGREPVVSLIVLVTERPEPLADLYREYSEPLRQHRMSFEFLFALQPWNEYLQESLKPLVAAGEPIRALVAGQTVSEASLLASAAPKCRGEVVVAMPAYRRITADGLLPLVESVRSGADMAVARRWPRLDSRVNRFQTRLFHELLARTLGTRELHDIASGVRAMRPYVIEEVPLYGDFSRFLPVAVLKEGYKVVEVEAAQHPADLATRLYGPGTYLRRFVDMLGVFFLLRFTYKPLRFFGLVGSVLTMAGIGILGVLFVQRLAGQGIADRPLLLLGLLLAMFGVQAIGLGLVGEMIVHLGAADRPTYHIQSPEIDPEDRSSRPPADGNG